MKTHISKRRRATRAFTLVEALVAVTIGSLFSAIFLDMYCQLARTNTSTQNELCASSIAQSMNETTHALGYDYLVQQIGPTISLQTNHLTTSPMAPIQKPDPLLLETVNRVWYPKTLASQFSGIANYSVKPASGINDAIQITTSVSWFDARRQMSTPNVPNRTVSHSMILTKSGWNLWSR